MPQKKNLKKPLKPQQITFFQLAANNKRKKKKANKSQKNTKTIKTQHVSHASAKACHFPSMLSVSYRIFAPF